MTSCEYRSWTTPDGPIMRCPEPASSELTFRVTPVGMIHVRRFCTEHAEQWLSVMGEPSLIELIVGPMQHQPRLFDVKAG